MHESIEGLFKRMQEGADEKFIVSFASEECLKTDDFIERIGASSKEYNVRVEFTTFNEVIQRFAKPYLDSLKSGNVDGRDIDPRAEGNAYATGCYVSRIELKKMNRQLEGMLLTSEKFAVYANDYGMDYPRKKMERLWNKMAFMQFHDCITGCHVDAGYEELIKVGRDVALGASQIFMEAAQVIERNIAIPLKEGYQSFVMFNPLNWSVKDNLLEAVLEIDQSSQIRGLTIEEADGRQVEVVDYSCMQNHRNKNLKVRFTGTTLPPIGYKVFYFKLEGVKDPLLEHANQQIENEYYRIQINSCGITSIYDKELQENVLLEGTGDLILEDDWGSPWNTLAPPFFKESISNPYYLEYVTKRDYRVQVKTEENSTQKVITVQGSYVNHERQVMKLLWKQEITLHKGIKKIFFHTEIDWDRLQVAFPLGFKTKDDEAYFEIPYGTLKRKSYKGQYDFQGAPNGDWPALNFVSCHHPDKDYSVTIVNKGLPCHRVADGTIYMGILRSPGHPAGAMFDFAGARDQGRHTFEYMITTNKGKLKEGGIVQTGIEFNTLFSNCQGTSKHGDLGLEHSFLANQFANQSENVIITSIKRAENSRYKVIRAYEAYGDKVEDSFEGLENCDILEVNLLEEPAGGKVQKTQYNGFDIKTFKIG